MPGTLLTPPTRVLPHPPPHRAARRTEGQGHQSWSQRGQTSSWAQPWPRQAQPPSCRRPGTPGGASGGKCRARPRVGAAPRLGLLRAPAECASRRRIAVSARMETVRAHAEALGLRPPTRRLHLCRSQRVAGALPGAAPPPPPTFFSWGCSSTTPAIAGAAVSSTAAATLHAAAATSPAGCREGRSGPSASLTGRFCRKKRADCLTDTSSQPVIASRLPWQCLPSPGTRAPLLAMALGL